MPYLSRDDIEKIASGIISQYKTARVPKRHLCYNVDPMELACVLGLAVDFQNLSMDGEILGMTSPDAVCVTICGPDFQEMMYYLDGRTVLVDKRLTESPKQKGRLHFTIAHEIAHQVIYREFPEIYGQLNCRTFCAYRKSTRLHKPVTDWTEWQADALASALLLPPDAVQDAMFLFGLGEKLKLLSRKYSQNNYERFCEMADFLQVSRTALAYRMEQLGLLERNLLIQEAPKGAC